MKRQKKRYYSIYLTIAMIGLVCYFFVSLFKLQTQVSAKRAEVEAVVSQYEEQSRRNDELQELLDKGDIDAFVEKRAKEEDMGYAFPDERIYYDMDAVK